MCNYSSLQPSRFDPLQYSARHSLVCLSYAGRHPSKGHFRS